jgi:hypothetical protein
MLEGEFGRNVQETLRTSPLVRDGYLAGEAVSGYVAEHFAGRRDRSNLLWSLFNFSLWYRRWILGEPMR